MAITERAHGAVAILDLTEIFREGEGPNELGDAIGKLLHHGTRQVLVNITNVIYMDDVGLNALVRAQETVWRAGGTFKLLNANKRDISGLMLTTKLLMAFESYDDEAGAVSSFTS